MDEGHPGWEARRERKSSAPAIWVSGRTAQRLAGHLRVHPDLVGKLESRVQDPAVSQAELLKVLPASVPLKLARETDTGQMAEEQDRAAQKEHMEGIVDERARTEVIPST